MLSVAMEIYAKKGIFQLGINFLRKSLTIASKDFIFNPIAQQMAMKGFKMLMKRTNNSNWEGLRD